MDPPAPTTPVAAPPGAPTAQGSTTDSQPVVPQKMMVRISVRAGEMWRNLGPEKAPYEAIAADDKERAKRETDVWKAANEEGPKPKGAKNAYLCAAPEATPTPPLAHDLMLLRFKDDSAGTSSKNAEQPSSKL